MTERQPGTERISEEIRTAARALASGAPAPLERAIRARVGEQAPLLDASPVAQRVEFDVPGNPIAKGRARHARRGSHVMTYTPEKTERYENLVKMAARQAMGLRPPIEGPVRLILHVAVPIPASWSQRRQSKAAGGRIGATKKPDVSNVVKALEDGMNSVVYADDSQIVDLWVSKRYSHTPGVRVQAVELNLERA